MLEHGFSSPSFDLTPLRESETLYFLKTHQPTRDLVEPGDRVIYVVRDGRAATLSYQRYLRDFHETEASLLELLLGETFPSASWADHVAGWNPQLQHDTLLVFFEDLIAHPEDIVERVAAFADVPVMDREAPTFRDLRTLNRKFFSQGKTNSYLEGFSEDAQMRFLVASIREMTCLGYANDLPPPLQSLAEQTLLAIGDMWRESVEQLKVRRATDLCSAIKNNKQKNKELEERVSRQMSMLRKEVDNKNERLKHSNQLTERLNRKLKQLERQLAERKKVLNLVQRSLSWRSVRAVRRFFAAS